MPCTHAVGFPNRPDRGRADTVDREINLDTVRKAEPHVRCHTGEKIVVTRNPEILIEVTEPFEDRAAIDGGGVRHRKIAGEAVRIERVAMNFDPPSRIDITRLSQQYVPPGTRVEISQEVLHRLGTKHVTRSQ